MHMTEKLLNEEAVKLLGLFQLEKRRLWDVIEVYKILEVVGKMNSEFRITELLLSKPNS